MGPLGWQETVFIFVLALLIFGPKKLPELGKTIGKAMTEFRRASSELKSTFDREMRSLEQENQSLKEITQGYQNDLYNYDSSYYDSGAYGSESYNSNQESSSTVSASATQGADTPANHAPEGTVATAANHEPEPKAATEAREGKPEPRQS
jgi:TatA/E family protein of Tat protein translocase